jgi:hypothetical protein
MGGQESDQKLMTAPILLTCSILVLPSLATARTNVVFAYIAVSGDGAGSSSQPQQRDCLLKEPATASTSLMSPAYAVG